MIVRTLPGLRALGEGREVVDRNGGHWTRRDGWWERLDVTLAATLNDAALIRTYGPITTIEKE